MGLSVRQARGVYFLSGELDWKGGEDLRRAITIEPDDEGDLVLDLTGVTFVDPMGVRAIVILSRSARHPLVLRYSQDFLMRVFELLQLEEMPGILVEED